jgi:hypothetical protein
MPGLELGAAPGWLVSVPAVPPAPLVPLVSVELPVCPAFWSLPPDWLVLRLLPPA